MILQDRNQELLHVYKSLSNNIVLNFLCGMLILVKINKVDRKIKRIVSIVGNE